MNNNSIDQLESIIVEVRDMIAAMCDDMDAATSILEKETIRVAILKEEERLLDLIALQSHMNTKSS